MDMIFKALRILKPRTVIELGTFEGLGTEAIAMEMSKYLTKKGVLWTFDAGEPTLSDWPEHVRDEIMNQWPVVEKARAERIGNYYHNVDIVYIEGLTKDTLPRCMLNIGYWDFCYQDSAHDFDNIMIEWKILKKWSSIGSVIVFDDITLGHPFLEHFCNKETSWWMKHTQKGRSQLWAERRL